jgi:pimeloyl-ACP methyl ester carboxylesterase
MKLHRLVALLGLACLAPQILHAEPAPAPAAASAETRLPHISIRSIGHGDPVVLLPGLATPRAVWDGIAPELARGHRVLLVQVNGFGGDDPGANLHEGILAGAVDDLVR